jgi:hypothetical protein
MNLTSSSDTLNIINYAVRNNLTSSIITTVIAFRLLYVVADFMDCIVLPSIGMEIDEDAAKKVKGIKSQLLLISLFKFIVIVYIIFIITRLLRIWTD